MDTVSDVLHRVRAELRQARTLLRQEIAAYPTPIAGCDVQFNHLLADRRRIDGALAALDRAVFIPTPRQTMPPG
ncbi:hypothetical protein MWU52_06020 [Jannaschia sp. S6380]|uniref:hypothetical protein n=1 Tax=Jannaschia sp. S6380 TaxID=2926408 RepID=UPI001FF2BACA|nr:hypothetical protein [Jannaschia sp. S6380]MCK0167101.1 hypothetical protein [Jannaschia sp. S6380]